VRHVALEGAISSPPLPAERDLIAMKDCSEHNLMENIRRRFDRFINFVELAGLILIGLATAFAMASEAWRVLMVGQVSLTDLLLMFLYLEVLAMDARYLRLGQMPVRFPLYIAMASLARDLILRAGDTADQHVLLTTLGIAVLAISVYILRFGQHRYPSRDDEGREDFKRAETAERPKIL
jgi:protein PsiE